MLPANNNPRSRPQEQHNRQLMQGHCCVAPAGMGAGPNLQLYAPYVDRIVGVDINSAMHPYARRAAEAAGVGDKLQLLTGRAEALPPVSASADAVVMTHVGGTHPHGSCTARLGAAACLFLLCWARVACVGSVSASNRCPPASCHHASPPPLQVLCTVGDQQAALSEVLRVLKPGGRFIFLEHVAAPPGASLHRVQRVLNPAVRLVGHGCSATRCTLEAIQAAGFGSVEAESFRLDLWALSPAAVVSPHIAGTAVK